MNKIMPISHSSMNQSVQKGEGRISKMREKVVRCNNKQCKYQSSGFCQAISLNIDFVAFSAGKRMVCRSFASK